jgi:hypothetical protein
MTMAHLGERVVKTENPSRDEAGFVSGVDLNVQP